jgi:hypothetical protein
MNVENFRKPQGRNGKFEVDIGFLDVINGPAWP